MVNHKDLFNTFKKLFPNFEYVEEKTMIYQNGKDSIRVRGIRNMSDLIFTYQRPNIWSLETAEHFLKE